MDHHFLIYNISIIIIIIITNYNKFAIIIDVIIVCINKQQ